MHLCSAGGVAMPVVGAVCWSKFTGIKTRCGWVLDRASCVRMCCYMYGKEMWLCTWFALDGRKVVNICSSYVWKEKDTHVC